MATRTIHLELVRHELKKQPNEDVIARYIMKKPSDLPSIYRAEILQVVRLDVKREGDDFLFNRMLKINHKNILRLEAIQDVRVEGDTIPGVFVENYHGYLIDYIKHLVADNFSLVIPSEAFRDLVKQIIDGIEELRINGVYHGAISIENIYYVIVGNVPIIKLANFRQLIDTSLEIAQLGDWIGLGNVLAYISNAARRLNNNFSRTMIDRLASKLQGLTDTALLPHLKAEILADPFFWGKRRRVQFYIHDVAESVKDDDFAQSVKDYPNWSLPWKNNPHNGLVSEMAY